MRKSYLEVIFLVLWLVTLFISLIEVVTYSGFFQKRVFFLNPHLLLIVVLGFALFFKFNKRTRDFYNTAVFKVNFLLMLILAGSYLIFNIMERKHFPNYVFSKFHLHPSGIILPLLLSLILFFVSSRLGLFERNILNIFIPFLLLANLSRIDFTRIIADLKFIFFNRNLETTEKMKIKVGSFIYDYSQFIKNNTPENATILVPPQNNPWPQTGNVGYFRYFLYPRRLINGQEFDPGIDLRENKIDYVLIAWGESKIEGSHKHGWPKFDLEAEKIIYYYPDSRRQKSFYEDYTYKDSAGSNVWGIIQIKK